ncbi:hypothetical protein Tco_1036046 [Tanacetum coccineum]
MADLKFVDQHNMVACLEKTEENTEFHQIVDFLSTCSINYALTAVVISESSVRSDLLFNDEDGIACLTNDEIFENLALMGYEQLSTKLTFQKGKVTPLFDSMLVQNQAPEGEGDSPRRQDTTLGGADAQTRPKTAFKTSCDPHLSKVNTFGRGEDSMEYHDKLTDFVPPTPHGSCLRGSKDCSRQSDHQIEIEGQEARKEEKGRNYDKTKELNLTDKADTEVIVEDKGSGEKGGSTADQVSTTRLEVSDANVHVNVSAATPSTPPTTTTIFGDEDLTIAQTLVKIRSKGVLVEEEPEKPVKVKRRDQGLAQIESDAELAQRLHEEELAELDRAQKERQKKEEATSVSLAKEFGEIQAIIDADHELAVRLTHEEQEKYTIKERARLLAEFFERRKKQLVAERVEVIRNKPPTRTQVRDRMITYLKHMDKYTHQQIKHKKFEEVQKLYEKEKKWINDFKPIDDDSQQQAESTKKRPRVDFEEESSKK